MALHSARMSRSLTAILALILLAAGSVRAQDSNAELTKVKEQELEEVRARISSLKKSMDKRAAERDRITTELQAAEVLISEKRINLREIERQKEYSERKRAEIDARLRTREAELERESDQLAARAWAAS